MVKTNALQSALDRVSRDALKPVPDPLPSFLGAKPKRSLVQATFEVAVVRQLKMLAAEDGMTIQAELSEALDDLFVKRGKARMAAL